MKQVGREPGVRYVLEGSVRRSDKRVRIAAQLINTASGANIWASRFGSAIDDIFDLQDKVASCVAGAIEPAVQTADTARTADYPTRNLTAYALYLRAYALYFSSVAQIPEALRLLKQAIEHDPCYGPAVAWAAVCCNRLVRDQNGSYEDYSRKGIRFARQALAVGKNDPRTMTSAALALNFFGEDIVTLMALVDRAVALNPSFACGWRVSGSLRWWNGQPERAIEDVEVALRLDPSGSINRSFLS